MRTAARFASERFAAIDRALRAGEFPNAASIAARLEVSRRTAQRDFAFLRDRLGAPLAFDRARNGFFYADPTYRLPAVGLTEGELVAVCLAGESLRHFEGGPLAAPLDRALRKVLAGLRDRVTVDLGELARGLSFRTTAPADLDPGLFGRLVAAVREGRRLRLRYYSADRDAETDREIDPYHLACVDGHWYLLALCHDRGAVRIFAPARIRALEDAGPAAPPPRDFDPAAYLADAFAVTRGGDGERHRVRLRFVGAAARYVAERAWHPSQAAGRDGDALVLAFELSHTREVERWALSWGDECEVLGPPELRDRVARTLRAAAARYDPDAEAEAPARPTRSTRTRRTHPER